jgi:hypothetical protein
VLRGFLSGLAGIFCGELNGELVGVTTLAAGKSMEKRKEQVVHFMSSYFTLFK